MASLYCDGRGNVSHNLRPAVPEVSADAKSAHPATLVAAPAPGVLSEGSTADQQDEKLDKSADKKTLLLCEGRWMVVSASVEVAAGRMTTYLDGQLLSVEDNLEPRDLSLGPRLIILGGGKAAQSRGGSVRRVLVRDASMDAEQAMQTYIACAQHHPAIAGKLAIIQAVWRGRQARKHNVDVLAFLAKAKEKKASKKK
jgi:hypothetical protein